MGTIEMEIPVHIHKTHALGGSDLPTHPFGHVNQHVAVTE